MAKSMKVAPKAMKALKTMKAMKATSAMKAAKVKGDPASKKAMKVKKESVVKKERVEKMTTLQKAAEWMKEGGRHDVSEDSESEEEVSPRKAKGKAKGAPGKKGAKVVATKKGGKRVIKGGKAKAKKGKKGAAGLDDAGEDRSGRDRDRLKALWFRSHRDELDPSMAEMFDKQEHAVGGRRKNSDLINNIVMRTDEGEYEFELDNPKIEERGASPS